MVDIDSTELEDTLRISKKFNQFFFQFHKNQNRLLEKPRQCINTDTTDFHWNPIYSDLPDFIKSNANDLYGNRAIFPLHSTLKTQSRHDTDLEFMHLHCNQLHDLTQMYVSNSIM